MHHARRNNMKRGRYLYALAAGAGVGIAFGPWNQSIEAKQNGSTLKPPTFKVDPFWPKPLPDNWVTGEIGGVCVDAQDHVFILNRAELYPKEKMIAKVGPPSWLPAIHKFPR